MKHPDLVGIAEIAERLGVSRQAVSNWWTRGTVSPPFPEPIVRLRMGGVWDWAAVNAWHRARVPRPDLERWES